MQNAWVYFDTETHPIAPGRLAPKLVCFQMAEGGGEVSIHLASDPRTHGVVEKALGAFRLVGHNVAFDLAVLGAAYPDLLPAIWRAYDEGRVCDTMIAAQMLDIAHGKLSTVRGAYSLKGLAERHCKLGLAKGDDSWQLRYNELEYTPVEAWPEDARRYATLDVQATRAVWQQVGSHENEETGTREIPTFRVQMRAAWALHLASCWGMRCDPAQVDKLRASIAETQNRLRDKLVTTGMLRPNGTRDDAAVRARAAQAGVTKLTAKGQVSIDAAALQDIDDPVIATLVEYQKAGKLASTYLPVVERGTREPIHCRYGLVESGRTSCSGPNLQNLPRGGGVRECFVPRPGFVFVSADYSVIELVCLAQVLVDRYDIDNSRMALALLAGRDLHLVTAGHILGKRYDETVALYKSGDKGAKQARQLAKGLNFGIPGGLGPAKLRQLLRGYGHHVTEGQARLLKEKWLGLYPEMRMYFEAISRYCGVYPEGQVLQRHPITGFVRGGLDYCSLANHNFQHLASYGAKIAVYAVQRACFAPDGALSGSRLVAFVHDELVLEVPEDRCHEAACELTAIMEGEFTLATPDLPVTAQAVAMRRWAKDAAPTYRDGKLVPWGDP